MNLKPINEVPEVEALQEGDKILINSGGAAMQIAAEKVGGSGGGITTIYGALGTMGEGVFVATAYADKEMTKPLTFAEGKAILESGMRLALSMAELGVDSWAYLFPMVQPNEEAKAFAIVSPFADQDEIPLVFSDTDLGV